MRGRGRIAGNPVLIGAATVLVVIVAVFLSYNANHGLPFVPSYALNAETPSAANLVRGNDVRIGGTRVGSVDSITAKRLPDGTSVAVLGLKLERAVAPLPRDTTVLNDVRSAARASAPSTRSRPSGCPTGPASPCSGSSSNAPSRRCRATRPC